MGPTGFPEMSVMNYHYTLRISPEERGSHLVRGAGQKSQKLRVFPQEQIKLHVVYCRTEKQKNFICKRVKNVIRICVGTRDKWKYC